MAANNLDVVRRNVAAVNRGDVAATVESFDPGIVFEPQRASVGKILRLKDYGESRKALEAAGLRE
jgi:hypothetical protein